MRTKIVMGANVLTLLNIFHSGPKKHTALSALVGGFITNYER